MCSSDLLPVAYPPRTENVIVYTFYHGTHTSVASTQGKVESMKSGRQTDGRAAGLHYFNIFVGMGVLALKALCHCRTVISYVEEILED